MSGMEDRGGCGCRSTVYITEKELSILASLAEYSFLPVGLRADSGNPVVLTDASYDGNALLLMKLKGLITVDLDVLLDGFDYTPYRGFSRFGSAALTEKGLDALETLDIVGITP